jgi:hypothetical protein
MKTFLKVILGIGTFIVLLLGLYRLAQKVFGSSFKNKDLYIPKVSKDFYLPRIRRP